MGSEKERALVTQHLTWQNVGTIDSTAAGSDSQLAYGERFYETLIALDNGIGIEIPSGINGVEVRFKLSNNNDDVDIDVWASKREDDNLRLVCTLDVVAGNQTSDDGYKFADTINISNEDGWPQEPVGKTPAADYMAVLVFDLCGYSRLAFHGFGTFDSDCVVEVSGY